MLKQLEVQRLELLQRAQWLRAERILVRALRPPHLELPPSPSSHHHRLVASALHPATPDSFVHQQRWSDSNRGPC